MKYGFKITLISVAAFLFSACAGTPTNLTPVTGFEESRYLGTWYEVARLDHGFERGLSNVTANYSLREDGKIKVVNRGWSEKKQAWKDATGKAKFKGERDKAHLKVSFFGPFYGDYIVFDLEKEKYGFAFVGGPTDKYLWLLARTPAVNDEVKQRFTEKAARQGYDTDALIWVDQSKAVTP